MGTRQDARKMVEAVPAVRALASHMIRRFKSRGEAMAHPLTGWWTFSARAALGVAFGGWVAVVAGYAQHQERLGLTAKTPVSLDNPEQLLDRISSWAFLLDARYFARYRSTLDPGAGFQKFWWLAGLQAFGLAVGAAATVFPRSHARLLASGILAMGQAPDLPESAVEILANYRDLGVPLPAYRVAQVVGGVVVPLANLAAAMVLGWEPVDVGPDVMAVDPPPPEARGLSRAQAWVERVYLGGMDRARVPILGGLTVSMWAATACGWAGYAIGVASGAWWRTHVPLCGVALAAQVLANGACTLSMLPAAEGRASGAALAATSAAFAVSVWRWNRAFAPGLSLLAVRAGATPPPGYVIFNVGVILWLLVAAATFTPYGCRRPQAGDAAFCARPYRVFIFFVAGPLAFAGVVTMTAATLLMNTPESERSMWADRRVFRLTGDRYWLLYTVFVYYVILFKQCHVFVPMIMARSRETMIYGSLIVALGTNYMANRSTDRAMNVGLWLVLAGFMSEAVATTLATDSPCGVHSWPGRAWRACGLVRSRTRAPGSTSTPLLVAQAAADPESGGLHTVRLLLPQDVDPALSPESGSGSGRGSNGNGGNNTPDVVLEKLIGCGSFASVFRARYAGAPCAVKVLSSASPSAQAAARKEALLALSLRHPNVVQSFAVLTVDVPASTLAEAATMSSSSSGSGGASPAKDGRAGSGGQPSPIRPALADAATAAMAEFAAVLHAPHGEGGGLSPGAGAVVPAPTSSGCSSSAAHPASCRQTWLVLELADRGTLDRAIRVGAFRREGGRSATPRSRAGSPRLPTTPDKSPVEGGASVAATATAAVLATLHDCAAGLAYLHTVDVIHGDVKPANVLLRSRARDRAGRRFSACMSDFGLSRALAPGAGVAGNDGSDANPAPSHLHTHTFGTVSYTAPEMMREGRLSRSADCYALGMILWELWTGEPPFHGVPAASIFYSVGVKGERPSLDGFQNAPPGYVELMTALWADAMHERPTAAQAAQRLKAMLDAELGGGGGGLEGMAMGVAGQQQQDPQQRQPSSAGLS